ncbi:MAG: S1 RNA-binding domain-containing protein [Anaerolineales bacterium]|nr:S1 RNA-binding domain-containing protein [Anaerolineales bacterium]MCB9432094.1 S1 RNA-binding domain-containing protein [Ardenticatenaceae bacterium]
MIDAGSGMIDHPMAFLLNEELSLPTVGELRTGVVVEHRENVVLVDIGSKSEGMIDNRELASMETATRDKLTVGNEVLVYVVDPEDSNGNLILSFVKAEEEQDWHLAQKLLKTQNIYETEVVGFNKGGILVAIGHLRGFIPNSQLRRDRLNHQEQSSKQRYFQKLIGSSLSAKVLEVNRERSRLILSETAAENELREERRNNLFANIQENDGYEGHIVNVANFGVFVDIGGVEGLVHLSELSWKRVNNPSEIYKVGDPVKVAVLNVDQDKQRIALSIKRLQPDPWTLIEEIYQVGQLLSATITRLTKFGAFARLNDDYQLEGLIHISELSEDRVEHPREVVKTGDKVNVRIIRVDADQRQLGLSLKQVASEKYMEADLQMLTTL